VAPDLERGPPQSAGAAVYLSAPIAIGGSYVISVVATDEVGLTSDAMTAAFTIEQTSGPMLAFTAPAANAVVGEPSIVVRGTSGTAVSITVNDVPGQIDAVARTFSANVPLLEGANDVV